MLKIETADQRFERLKMGMHALVEAAQLRMFERSLCLLLIQIKDHQLAQLLIHLLPLSRHRHQLRSQAYIRFLA